MIRSLFVASFLMATPALAQDLELPVASPAATVSQQVGTVTVSVSYYSPGKKDRDIWGELVPYGEVWRTGANSGTRLTTTSDAVIGGEKVPAGEYLVMTIPGESGWTVILNKDLATRPWNHNADNDLTRFEVAPAKGPERERLTFLFSDTDDDGTNLDLEWDGVRVTIPIEVDTVGGVKTATEAYVSRASRKLADSARFHAKNGENDAGLALVTRALALHESWYATFVKAEMLHEKGEAKLAYKAAKRAHELGAGTEGFFWEDCVEKALAEWPKK